MIAKLGVDGTGNKLRQELQELATEGTVVPFSEVYIRGGNAGPRKGNPNKKVEAGRVITPKVLGGDEEVDAAYADPRQPLMDWLRQKDNPYFARSFVNRVWAHYFNVGIVEPADDMNLANAPSNKELLDYLAAAFIEHDYDIRWLMREIALSDTYQRSWKSNATNELDLRNFSRNVPRRLPAEVVYDAVVSATAGQAELAKRRDDPVEACAIGVGLGYTQRQNNKTSYALSVFGKPKRETPCDCERSNEPSLLQTVFLRNDQETFNLITRRNGWFHENVAAADALEKSNVKLSTSNAEPGDVKNTIRYLQRTLAEVTQKEKDLRKKQKKDPAGVDKDELRKLATSKEKMEARIQELSRQLDDAPKAKKAPTEVAKVAVLTPTEMINEAYLRTFSRLPTADERSNAEAYLRESSDLGTGLRDLIWALLNSKEFVVNH
jgi:hypothetical protein